MDNITKIEKINKGLSELKHSKMIYKGYFIPEIELLKKARYDKKTARAFFFAKDNEKLWQEEQEQLDLLYEGINIGYRLNEIVENQDISESYKIKNKKMVNYYKALYDYSNCNLFRLASLLIDYINGIPLGYLEVSYIEDTARNYYINIKSMYDVNNLLKKILLTYQFKEFCGYYVPILSAEKSDLVKTILFKKYIRENDE